MNYRCSHVTCRNVGILLENQKGLARLVWCIVNELLRHTAVSRFSKQGTAHHLILTYCLHQVRPGSFTPALHWPQQTFSKPSMTWFNTVALLYENQSYRGCSLSSLLFIYLWYFILWYLSIYLSFFNFSLGLAAVLSGTDALITVVVSKGGATDHVTAVRSWSVFCILRD